LAPEQGLGPSRNSPIKDFLTTPPHAGFARRGFTDGLQSGIVYWIGYVPNPRTRGNQRGAQGQGGPGNTLYVLTFLAGTWKGLAAIEFIILLPLTLHQMKLGKSATFVLVENGYHVFYRTWGLQSDPLLEFKPLALQSAPEFPLGL